jgi:hypothetical protein
MARDCCEGNRSRFEIRSGNASKNDCRVERAGRGEGGRGCRRRDKKRLDLPEARASGRSRTRDRAIYAAVFMAAKSVIARLI